MSVPKSCSLRSAPAPSVTAAASGSNDQPNPKPKKKGTKLKVNACRMIAWSSSVPNRFLIALDSCAHSTVLCNADFCSDKIRGKCAPLYNWNGEAHFNEISGNFHPFGYCEVNKNTPINLLSEFEVRSRFQIEDVYADSNRVGNPVSKIVIIFDHRVEFRLDFNTRQYVVDWRPFAKLFSESPSPKVLDVVINFGHQNEAMYSPREENCAFWLYVQGRYYASRNLPREHNQFRSVSCRHTACH